ncbi:unnamed protein product [Mytilus coruscus]|uniref:Uncharacterized protein n=1 Tax=Mytilus coruscus TaxID=42192 RepID=A0A6J8ABA2_MYTCO|nr:unnamed protein product [Mytilus coruscus]
MWLLTSLEGPNCGKKCYSVKTRQFLHETFVENWKAQIFYSPKSINYRIYKTEFGLEKYLSVLPPDLMYNIIKLRCGNQKLKIEAGRFFTIDRSERICDLCDKEQLGDEFHIFNWNVCSAERHEFIPVHIYNDSNIISLSEIMNSHDKYTLVGLAKFCKIVMSVFK